MVKKLPKMEMMARKRMMKNRRLIRKMLIKIRQQRQSHFKMEKSQSFKKLKKRNRNQINHKNLKHKKMENSRYRNSMGKNQSKLKKFRWLRHELINVGKLK